MEIDRAVIEAIRRDLAAVYPLEGCGFLMGTPRTDGRAVVSRQLRVPNERVVDGGAANRYLIPPEAFLTAERDATALGLNIVGTYHSHPDVPARPSGYDREHAWPSYRYLIVSVVQGTVREERVWQLREDRSGFVDHGLRVKEQ